MTNGALSILRIVVAIVVISSFGDRVLAQSQRAPSTAPGMTEEIMGRLIKYTCAVEETGSVVARICKVLELCSGTADMPLKLAKSDSTDGEHYFGIPPNADSKDILILVKRNSRLEAYLTDKTAGLRAAAISENEIARLITNESAAAKFKAELALFAKEAAEQLPAQ
jgi:hypothetical protein